MNNSKEKEIVKKAVAEAISYCGSQVILAEKAKVTQGAISKYLRGAAMPTGRTARNLSDAVDETVSLGRFAPLIFIDESE